MRFLFLSALMAVNWAASGHGLSLPATPCMANCTGVQNGNYQACTGCKVFATCVQGKLYHVTCVGGTVWDDSYKHCRETSSTCHQRKGQCVSSCVGRSDGSYPSCRGCNFYLICVHNHAIDGRLCPRGLVFNADINTCAWTSPYCKL